MSDAICCRRLRNFLRGVTPAFLNCLSPIFSLSLLHIRAWAIVARAKPCWQEGMPENEAPLARSLSLSDHHGVLREPAILVVTVLNHDEPRIESVVWFGDAGSGTYLFS